MTAARAAFLLAAALMALLPGAAAASGIPMAEEWDWARDGGRIINSLVVLGAVAWLVIRFGGPVVKRRAQSIAERLRELEEARAKAMGALARYEEKLKSIEAESEKVREEARREGEMIRQRILEQARREAALILEKAGEQVALETEKARQSLKRDALTAALDAAEEILKRQIGPADHKRLVEDYLSRVEKMN